jgi:methylglyoxal reductase
MNYVQLPHSSVSLPPVIIGTWILGGKNWGHVDQKESIKTIEAALDQGFHAFDTAPAYGHGKAEELLGSIVGNNSDAIIMTKAGLEIDNFFNHNLSPQSLEKELTASLKRLKRDYIDIYICHWPDPETPVEATIEAMNDFKEKGLIKSYGLSNYHGMNLKEALFYGEISLVQMRHSVLFQNFTDDISISKKNKIPVSVYGTLEGGLLTGKYGNTLPSFSKKDVRNFFYKYQNYSEKEIKDALGILNNFANEKKISPSIAAASWCLEKKEIDSVIVGARNKEQIDDLFKNFK